MKRTAIAAALIVLLAPTAAAEFGHEHDGFPVNMDGHTIHPYIPADWAARHPGLVDRLLAGEHSGDLLHGGLHEAVHAEGHEDPLNKINGYTLFPYYPLLTAELQRLAEAHPHLVRLTSTGQSHLGLELWLLEIADFSNPDKVPLQEREVIYLDGGTHSNEYSAVYFVTEWAQFLLDEYETNETARWIVENRHTWILPMVNPDGSHAFGRVNLIDVNINRNFPATWGTVDELPVLNWPGLYPASEPETQAVLAVLDQVRPDYVNSIHCCGNLWLHPYGAEHLGHARDIEMFTRTCHEVFPDLTVDVDRVRCGETWSTIYPASGTTLDEGYSRVGASSWTYEMSGRGAIAPWGQPIIDDDPRIQETESWRGVMHAFLHVEKYGGLPVLTAVEGERGALQVSVQNQGYGPLHRATLHVGGHAVSLDDLEPGQTGHYRISGSWSAGPLPVELEWQKRLHPESNWGHQRLVLDLRTDAGRLHAALPPPPEKPGMSHLMPEAADLAELGYGAPGDVARDVGRGDAQAASGPAVLFVLLALVGMAVLGRRLPGSKG